MKIIYRIPSKDPYGYVEIEKEINATDKQHILAEEILAVEELESLMVLQKVGKSDTGLPKKEMDTWLDTYLLSQTGDVNQYSKMSDSQKECVQAIKRSLARIKSKQEIE